MSQIRLYIDEDAAELAVVEGLRHHAVDVEQAAGCGLHFRVHEMIGRGAQKDRPGGGLLLEAQSWSEREAEIALAAVERADDGEPEVAPLPEGFGETLTGVEAVRQCRYSISTHLCEAR